MSWITYLPKLVGGRRFTQEDLDRYIETVEQRLSNQDGRLSGLILEISRLQTKLADQEKALAKLVRGVTEGWSQCDRVVGRVGELGARVEQIKLSVTTLKAAI